MMKKIFKGFGLIAGAAAVIAGGKLIYDAYNENESVDAVEDVVETEVVEETAEEVTPVVDETTEDTVEDTDSETTV